MGLTVACNVHLVTGTLSFDNAQSENSTSISLHWVKPSGQGSLHYRLTWNHTAMEANLVILDRNATSFVISGLRKHTTYTVTMTAVSSHGDIQTRVEVTTKEDGML